VKRGGSRRWLGDKTVCCWCFRFFFRVSLCCWLLAAAGCLLLLPAASCRLPAAAAIMLALMVSNSKSVQLYQHCHACCNFICI